MKKILAVGVILVFVIAVGVAYALLRTPEAASAPIQAVPVIVEATPTSAPIQEKATPAVGASDKPEASTPDPISEPVADTGSTVFGIVQAQSEARFIINEVLNGAPKTVVGTTDQVAGEIAINTSNPAESKVGEILINARTLATDNDFRNRAIKNQILNTNEYEFITFTPTELVGLPDGATVGESYTFQIKGDLTVRDVTRNVIFDVMVTPTSETQIKGMASTTILYADYGIVIPKVRAVASVDDDVKLEIEFVAVAK